jgi:hypothetical protein
VSNDKPFVSNDKPFVSSDKPFVSSDKPFVGNDKPFVSSLLRQAEAVLEIAVRGEQDVAIVIENGGGIRMIDPTGWSLSGLAAESGAEAVFKVERRAGALRVEGWDSTERCLIQRPIAGLSSLHHSLRRGRDRGSGKERLEQPVSRELGGHLRIEKLEANHLAVLRYPDIIDQPALRGVVRVFDSNPYQSVAECEHYTLESSAVAVYDGYHVHPSCGHCGCFG